MSAEFRLNTDDHRAFLVSAERSWRPEVRLTVTLPTNWIAPPVMSASEARLLGKALIAAAEEAEIQHERTKLDAP